jgi:hypothetical protein
LCKFVTGGKTVADAITALLNGFNYQARVFWDFAFDLLIEGTPVAEVTFEANKPKAFDDVFVKYETPIAGLGPDRVTADYYQIKWHVKRGGCFGYEDFVKPKFIGATKYSLLQRLQQARRTVQSSDRFTFLTTDKIKDGDPLSCLICGTDRSLAIETLFDGTTDGSNMGKVRKYWREHLELVSDAELQAVVTGFRIFEQQPSLDELRTKVNEKAHRIGLQTYYGDTSDFRYDELAKCLKSRKLNTLTREGLRKFCREEGLNVSRIIEPDRFLLVAIRSFLGLSADIYGADPDNTLMLTDYFRDRYLQDGHEWQRDIRPKVESFLKGVLKKSAHIRLILDAHASIAFLAGSVLHLKSGVNVELVQKGRIGACMWRANDGSVGSLFDCKEVVLGSGTDTVVEISASRAVDSQSYIGKHLPNVGKILSFIPPEGNSSQAVTGGQHAVALADQISDMIRLKSDPNAVAHIFAACPNSLLFFLGQHHRGIAPCIFYEFDFEGNKTYHPSFSID